MPTAHVHTYRDTLPPWPNQREYAQQLFHGANVTLLTSCQKLHQVPDSDVPEVCFLGSSNVGKSSLLNAIFEPLLGNRQGKAMVAAPARRELARVSRNPGHTRTINMYGVGADNGRVELVRGKGQLSNVQRIMNVYKGKTGFVVVDMPGYGYGSQKFWGEGIWRYLKERKQYVAASMRPSSLVLTPHARLRRAFLLIDSRHSFKPHDLTMLAMLRDLGVAHQIVFTKLDCIYQPGQDVAIIRKLHDDALPVIQPSPPAGQPALGDILSCSTQLNTKRVKMGLEGVRWAILQATGVYVPQPKREIVVPHKMSR